MKNICQIEHSRHCSPFNFSLKYPFFQTPTL
ncbi:hypothetical protein [Iningainema tapete]